MSGWRWTPPFEKTMFRLAWFESVAWLVERPWQTGEQSATAQFISSKACNDRHWCTECFMLWDIIWSFIKTVNYLLVGAKGATGELWWSQLDAPINFSWGKKKTTVLCLKSEQTCLRNERGYQVRCVALFFLSVFLKHPTVTVVAQQSNEKVRQDRWSNNKCTKETPEMTRWYVGVM